MPLRQHCDRCDALCDECQTWVDVPQETDIGTPTKHAHPDAADTYSQIWHIEIGPTPKNMFCRACRIAILEAHVKGLKG